jgi:hypothetical protein
MPMKNGMKLNYLIGKRVSYVTYTKVVQANQ